MLLLIININLSTYLMRKYINKSHMKDVVFEIFNFLKRIVYGQQKSKDHKLEINVISKEY